jgi:transposase
MRVRVGGRQRRHMQIPELGAPEAITATAHKLARILHHSIKHCCAYDQSIFAPEEELHRKRREKNLRKQAALFGFQLTPLQDNS